MDYFSEGACPNADKLAAGWRAGALATQRDTKLYKAKIYV